MVFAQAGDTGRARGTRAGWKVGLGGGKNQDGCSLFSVERALAGWVGEFPLTPTLSQRERGNCPQRVGRAGARRCPGTQFLSISPNGKIDGSVCLLVGLRYREYCLKAHYELNTTAIL
jgi:hypothetical protein